MVERKVAIETADGRMETVVVHPEGGGAHPAVILYMDAPGIREELLGFARRIAGQGYLVLLPDLYYRLGRVRFDLSKFTADDRRRMFACMESLSNTLVVRDTAGMLGYLANEPAAREGGIGCIGYCMSGQFVVSAAGMFPEDVAAAASLYGVGIVTEGKDSPHLLASKIKGELYFGFAETDEYVPANVVGDLRAVLDAQKVAYRLDIWPGTGHGFCFPERDTYAEDAAEQVWGLVFDLFARRLGEAGAA